MVPIEAGRQAGKMLPRIKISDNYGCWRTILIPALGKQNQAGLCELEVRLAYEVRSEF